MSWLTQRKRVQTPQPERERERERESEREGECEKIPGRLDKRKSPYSIHLRLSPFLFLSFYSITSLICVRAAQLKSHIKDEPQRQIQQQIRTKQMEFLKTWNIISQCTCYCEASGETCWMGHSNFPSIKLLFIVRPMRPQATQTQRLSVMKHYISAVILHPRHGYYKETSYRRWLYSFI